MADPDASRTCYDVIVDILTDLAPGETPFLPEVWDVYRGAPAKRRTRDRVLGAGIRTRGHSWTYLVLMTVGSVLLETAEKEDEDGQRSGGPRHSGRSRWRLGRRGSPEPQVPDVPPERRQDYITAVWEKAAAIGIEPEQLDRLVAAIERHWLGDSGEHPGP
ncbi:hypothetical protein [Parafrankia elaeagni]|uniref:hypothetical protein n=1 Tax=Parafrankia elaeagni TaxID=222534 RepID=UPI00035F2128|nr:hypothetical protein [Parafrankia elaeagni]